MRERARNLIAQYIRYNQGKQLEPARAQYRASLVGLPKYPPPVPEQGTYLTGSTDATYWKPIEYQRRKNVDTYGRRR
jgi:hypothetical protein